MFVHRGALEPALRPEDYSSDAAFDEEIEGLFAKAWHLACTRRDLPGPGSWLARDVLGVPVVIHRTAEGLRAFRNVCAHRHCLVVPPGTGRAEALRCQYHAWEYGSSGRVSRIPDGPSFRGLRAEGLSLEPLRLDTLGEMVFVSLAAEGEGLVASWGDLASDLERFFGRHRLVWTWITEHDVNWKVIAENAVESYHVPSNHPGTFADYRPEELHDHTLDKRFTRYRDRKPFGNAPVDLGFRFLARVLLAEPTYERFTQAHAFPHLLLYYGELFSSLIALEPAGPRRTRHVQLGFVPRDLRAPRLGRPLQTLFAWAMVPRLRRIIREDMRIWPDVQHGLDHGRGAGVLSAREERVFAFQEHVATCRRRAGGDPARGASVGSGAGTDGAIE